MRKSLIYPVVICGTAGLIFFLFRPGSEMRIVSGLPGQAGQKNGGSQRWTAASDWVKRLHAAQGDKERSIAVAAEMKDFDALQKKAVIETLMDSSSGLEQREFLAQLLLGSLAVEDSEEALRTFEELRAKGYDPKTLASLFEGILQSLAGRDPAKAASYFLSHSDLWPDPKSRESAAESMLFWAAAKDPGRALGMMGKFGDIDSAASVRLAFSGRPLDLPLVREFIAKNPGGIGQGLLRGAFGLYGERMLSRPFAESVNQIDAAKMSPAELHAAARGIAGLEGEVKFQPGRGMKGEEIPVPFSQWLGWLKNQLSSNEYVAGAAKMTAQWALQDPDSAEAWIVGNPDREVKAAAAASFVAAINPTDPERAARIANLLSGN